MEQYIKKSALVAEIERLFEKAGNSLGEYRNGAEHTLISINDFLDTLEVKEVDLDRQAEWIANGIMIAVQSAKLHTNVYNPERKDYDHSHLMQAARRGIKLGLKIAQKGEEV